MNELAQLIVFSGVLFMLIPAITLILIAGIDAIERQWKRYADARERRKRDAEWDAFWNSMTDSERAKWERFGAHLADVVNASAISMKDIEL